ncbi:hypothetical protein FB004_109116 [Sinorhizobium medicae]|uniref:Uncharacterized protein n=3 Tax=Sinorhizobium medicae TaxID=110321 RepID=A0A508X133_9HYPH|nr:hypothetical protein FB006_115117 [Sinorhizobium medicae]TWA21063.1 hypothetical protein FB004_109116 [Sinorhizobium medicae]TWA33580.1 hypothetical protein FB007_108125 [Sinorhizobium medicae]TWA35608.1 hypothetical protein FB009_11383 [Sinorhizobium medicae]TWA47953.1 hypothetical protein FB005_102354 [Sinorhizobium medicae]
MPMSASISRYLKDFSPPKIEFKRIPQGYFPDLDAEHLEERTGARPAVPEVDIDAERREAYAQGRAEARAEISLEHQKEIADLKARHSEEMVALTRRLEEQAAGKIAAGFGEMADRLALLLGDQTARVLAPVMDDALAKRAVDNLAGMVRHGLSAGEGITVTVRGPLALFETLKALLPETTAFHYVESGDVDLTVEVGEAILVTRMAAWSDTVRKVLA